MSLMSSNVDGTLISYFESQYRLVMWNPGRDIWGNVVNLRQGNSTQRRKDAEKNLCVLTSLRSLFFLSWRHWGQSFPIYCISNTWIHMPIFERTEGALNKIFGTTTLWYFLLAALAASKKCHKVVGGMVEEGRSGNSRGWYHWWDIDSRWTKTCPEVNSKNP